MLKCSLYTMKGEERTLYCWYLLYLSFSVPQTSLSLLTSFKHLTIFFRIYALSLPEIQSLKMMDLVIYYLCCTCQMWSHCPVFVDERPTLAGVSKSNSCSNWGDCQSKAELTESQEKPIRSPSRQKAPTGYVCTFNKADRQPHRANKHVNKCIQTHIELHQLVWFSKCADTDV